MALYKHDCEQCVPLGEFQMHDLYYCPQGGLPTLVARYGGDGPDYTSATPMMAKRIGGVLAEAERRMNEGTRETVEQMK